MSFDEIRCKSCTSGDLELAAGFLVCQACGTRHTVPGSFRGAGQVIKNRVAARAPKGFFVLWLVIAVPMFLFVPWIIGFVFSLFGSAIFATLGMQWLAQVAPICGIGCWPIIFVCIVAYIIVEAVRGSDKISQPQTDSTG